jgi:hypothetical protein
MSKSTRTQNSTSDLTANADLIENAGQITMDEPQMWGKGIVADFKRTVGTHWLQVRNVTS